MDHLGEIKLELADYFSFPKNFTELFNAGNSELKSIFEISLEPNPPHLLNYTIEMVSYTASEIKEIIKGEKIGESSVSELMGSSVEELLDSNRFTTNVTKTQQILVFNFKCTDPWLASAIKTDILKILICKQ